jgi:putative protein kinase ArgK-like GTPase of G3E family
MTQTTDQLLKRFFAEDTIALAKIISLIENRAQGIKRFSMRSIPRREERTGSGSPGRRGRAKALSSIS